MEALFRFVSGLAAGIAALFAPINPLVATTLLFIGVDFVSGIFADRAAARRAGREWYFESCKAWRTVAKMGLAVTAIAMAWMLDRFVLDFMQLNLAKLFTGFTCGVEFWSFLENAAQFSEAPLFRWLRREGWICSDGNAYNKPSEMAVRNGWMLPAVGNGKRNTDKSHFTPRLTESGYRTFVDTVMKKGGVL